MADMTPSQGAAAFTALRGFEHVGARIKADPRAAGAVAAWAAVTGLALLATFLVAGVGDAGWLVQILSPAVFVRLILSETAWQRFLLGAPRPGWRAYGFGAEEWRVALALLGTSVLIGLVLAAPVLLTVFILDQLDIDGLAAWLPFVILFAGLLILVPRVCTVISLSVLRGRVAVFDDVAETAQVWGSLILAAVVFSVFALLLFAALTTPLAVVLGGYEPAGALMDSVDWTALAWPPDRLELAALAISSVISAVLWLVSRAVCARAALDLEACAD